MAPKRNRYKEMERMMTTALIADAVLFVLYLIFAAAGVIWLKAIVAIVTILLSLACLILLYMTQELLRQRSLWMTTGFLSVFLCTVASLILSFP